jgi:tetratricopeptide (TPR) repeat protein
MYLQDTLDAISREDTETAIARLDCLSELDPENVEASIARSIVFLTNEDYGSLEHEALAIISTYPELDTGFILLGIAHALLDEHSEAVDTFITLNEQYPDQAIILAELGFALNQTSYSQAGDAYIAQATELNPEIARNYALLFSEFELLPENMEPVILYLTDRAITLNSASADPYLALATFYFVHENYTETTRNLETAVDLEPSLLQRGDVRHTLAVSYFELEDYLPAISHLTALSVADSEDPQVYALRAIAYLETGFYDVALNDILRAIEIEPENPAYYVTLGGIYDALEAHDMMMRYLHIKCTSKSPEMMQHLKLYNGSLN